MRLRNRRGAFSIMIAVGFFFLITVGAIAIDFSRLWTLKNELQTAADAGALAGAIQLFPARYAGAQGVIDSATVYTQRNPSMGRVPGVDSIILGNWNQSTRSFTAAGTPQNAVRVVAGYNMSGMIMSAFGVPAPRMRARATGWAEAPVATTGCIKPWAIPYEHLMFAINNYRGIPNTNANLNRAFDQVNDIAALNAMSAAQRTFTLKLGSGTITQAGATNTTMPGNFQAVQLPKLWDDATQTYPTPRPQSGANVYRDNITGATCYGLSVGDSLGTETGNMVGPTLQGADPGVCKGGIVQNGPNIGDCISAPGGPVGVDVKTAFFACGSGCNGRTTVGVKLIGSFTLMKVYPKGDTGKNPLYEKSQIVGIFTPIQDSGPVGGGSTTLQKPILAQ